MGGVSVRRRVWLEWKTLFWGNGRWRDVSALGRAWYVVWDWAEARLWRSWLRPHVRPRTWMRERYDFLLSLRVPHQLIGYIEGGEEGWGYAVTFCEMDGPRYIGPLCGDTEEEAMAEGTEFLRWAEKEAGTVGDSWTVHWRHGSPDQHTYTR